MTNEDDDLEFMTDKVGNAVLIDGNDLEKTISMVGGVRDTHALILFQVVNLDSCDINFLCC